MPYRVGWKHAVQEFLNTPFVEEKNTVVAIKVKPRVYPALLNLLKFSLHATVVLGKESIPFLKRMAFNAITKDNDENLNLRLEAIEKTSRTSISKIPNNQKNTIEKEIDIRLERLFKFKYLSDILKTFILLNMEILYFASNQDEIKEFIIKKCYELMLIQDAFKAYINDDDFKACLKNIVTNLIDQSDAYAGVYLKYAQSSTVKHLGFWYKDRRSYADLIFMGCFRRAQEYQIENYRFDRIKAKAFYSDIQRYKQSERCARIDSCVNTIFIMGVVFILSVALGIYDFPVPGAISAAASGLMYAAYMNEFFQEASDALQAFANDYTNKVGSLLEIKLVENKVNQIFELKLEIHIPQVLFERGASPAPSSWLKIRRKRIAPAISTEGTISAVTTDEASISDQKPRTIADTHGNIYYRLANNSFFRFNANELNSRRESINNSKLSLASVMQNILEKSDTIASADSKSDGIKYVGKNEKDLDAKTHPLKFKFKGAPYGSLRIALSSRDSRPEESELLKGQTTINSPALHYRH
jgi:hypothetical protein